MGELKRLPGSSAVRKSLNVGKIDNLKLASQSFLEQSKQKLFNYFAIIAVSFCSVQGAIIFTNTQNPIDQFRQEKQTKIEAVDKEIEKLDKDINDSKGLKKVQLRLKKEIAEAKRIKIQSSGWTQGFKNGLWGPVDILLNSGDNYPIVFLIRRLLLMKLLEKFGLKKLTQSILSKLEKDKQEDLKNLSDSVSKYFLDKNDLSDLTSAFFSEPKLLIYSLQEIVQELKKVKGEDNKSLIEKIGKLISILNAGNLKKSMFPYVEDTLIELSAKELLTIKKLSMITESELENN